MFAEQIDTPGRAGNMRRRASKFFFKDLYDALDKFCVHKCIVSAGLPRLQELAKVDDTGMVLINCFFHAMCKRRSLAPLEGIQSLCKASIYSSSPYANLLRSRWQIASLR